MKPEYREVELEEVEGRTLRGLALPFGVETRVGRVREMFAPGSTETTGEAILNAFHDQKRPLAREPETLRFEATDEGLRIEAEIPETKEGDDALELVRKRVVRGLSIEFQALRESVRAGVRIIERARILGVALALRPYYQGTTLEAREQDGETETLPLWVLS